MSNDNWIKVYDTPHAFKAEMIKGVLIENEIDAVALNQIDSLYQSFGTSKVMVQVENEEKALMLIEELEVDSTDEN